MPVSQAHIATDRAGRYLAQLCKHTGQMSQMSRMTSHRRPAHAEGGTPPPARHSEWSDTDGTIDFGWGRCTLHVTGQELTLTAEAENETELQRLQDGIARTLARIGRRDHLAVAWTPMAPEPRTDHLTEKQRHAAAIVDALMTPEGRADPFPLYAKAHELGPVSAFADGWFLVNGYDAVNQVLRDPAFGLPDPAESRSGGTELNMLSRSILRANPPDHGRMRSVLSQVFTPRRVAALRPAIEDAVDVLLDGLTRAGAGGTPVDFMDCFAYQLPVTVICELLGVPAADRDRFRPLASDLTEALELSADGAGTGPVAQAAARELSGYFAALIAERRENPADDLIGALVAVRDVDDDRLSETELLANLIVLLVAGFETTTSLLGNGLAILLDRPDLAAALRAKSVTSVGFVEEVLRYDSPVQVTICQVRAADVAVADVPVPEGSTLILLIGAANRDPDRYFEPDRFDPARTDIKPLSFGAGPHICLGNSLARLEAAVAFSRLLDRYRSISAADHSQATRRDRLVLRGLLSLPVVVTPG